MAGAFAKKQNEVVIINTYYFSQNVFFRLKDGNMPANRRFCPGIHVRRYHTKKILKL